MRTVPPVGVYCVAGCGADLLINICLTLLGYFPGHVQYVAFLDPLHPEQSLADCLLTCAPAPSTSNTCTTAAKRKPETASTTPDPHRVCTVIMCRRVGMGMALWRRRRGGKEMRCL